jgi:putative Holliday junction resolvase
MKILALDPGDKWVGVAISDALHITCKPLKTILLETIRTFLIDILSKEPIDTIIIGYPKTISGTESKQTKKIITLARQLQKEFSEVGGETIKWILWDERLSSKRAKKLQRLKYGKETKLEEHSIAAAFILQSYIDSQALHKKL